MPTAPLQTPAPSGVLARPRAIATPHSMPPAQPPNPSAFFPLPQGLGVSGVVTWAVDLANALAARGWSVGVALHAPRPGYRPVDTPFHPAVRVTDLSALPPMGSTGDDLSPFTTAYRDAIDRLGCSPASPCVLLPSLDADCYAAAAALTAVFADRLRVIGWQHSDTAFDTELMRTYEPMLHRIAGVSSRITERLAATAPWRAPDIVNLPYGVPVGPGPAPSDPSGPIRLIYTGRMEHEQKRIGVLAAAAAILDERAVPFEMTLIGDGPAAAEVDAALTPVRNASRLPPCSRERVRAHLAASHALLLPSRYEGLSLSMLESLAAGVTPIVARVDSGVSDAIEDGTNGLVIEADPDTPVPILAARFADAVQRLAADRPRLDRLRSNAHATARRFDHALHTDRCESLFRAAIAQPPRPWPAGRPCRFARAGSGVPADTSHGTVPPDANDKALAVLARLRSQHPGRKIAVYGAGRHTVAIADALAAHACSVDCVVDDDPARHGTNLWGWAVRPLADLPARGVRDVLVSSWIHREPMARRCTDAGLTPHPLY